MRRGWYLGEETFKDKLLAMVDGLGKKTRKAKDAVAMDHCILSGNMQDSDFPLQAGRMAAHSRGLVGGACNLRPSSGHDKAMD